MYNAHPAAPPGPTCAPYRNRLHTRQPSHQLQQALYAGNRSELHNNVWQQTGGYKQPPPPLPPVVTDVGVREP